MNTAERGIPTGVLILIAAAIAIGSIAPAIGLGVLSSHQAQAGHVSPTPVEGNATCSDFQQSHTWTEFKIDQSILGNKTFSDGTLSVTISNYTGTSFDWSSNIGVDAVFVKGGNVGGFLYLYDPEENSDTGLTTPNNPSGEPANISHVSFCYDVEAPTPTPKPTPTPTSTPTSTPAPTATLAATPTLTPVVLGAVQLPTAGGLPPSEDGNSLTALVYMLLAGATAMIIAAMAVGRWRLSTTSTKVIGTRDGRDGGWTWGSGA